MESRALKAGRQRGFSLFELMVYLLVVSILFATMLNRYRDIPGEAERANFMAVVAQLKAGVNLQMIHAIASVRWHSLQELEGSNPMDLMLETPTNYLGELSGVNPATIDGRTWYFDLDSGELVYTARNAENLYLIQDGNASPARQIRFRIQNVYGGESGLEWQGINLATVTPYNWHSVPLDQEINP